MGILCRHVQACDTLSSGPCSLWSDDPAPLAIILLHISITTHYAHRAAMKRRESAAQSAYAGRCDGQEAKRRSSLNLATALIPVAGGCH